MTDYIAEFEGYLINDKQVSSNTLESYLRDISQFAVYAASKGLTSASAAGAAFISEYIALLSAEGRSNATLTRVSASLRCYYQYLLSCGIVTANPAKGIKLAKAEKKLPEILTGKEITLLLSQPDIVDSKGCRDKAMLELLYATGIRVTELIDLKIHDFNPEIGILHLHNKKGERIVPMYPAAIKAVSDYLSRVRGGLSTTRRRRRCSPIMNGQPSDPAGLLENCQSLCKVGEHKKGYYPPHTAPLLRHPFAGERRSTQGYQGDARAFRYFLHAGVRADYAGSLHHVVPEVPSPRAVTCRIIREGSRLFIFC